MLRRADDLLAGPLPRVRSIPRPAASRRWRVPHAHRWALLLITLLGTALRFYRLTWPPLWNDDTLVFWRVCGTYGQMLVPLHDKDLFPPLHYSLYWLIGHPVPVAADVTRAVMGCVAGVVLAGVAAVGAGVAVRRETVWVRRLVPVAAAALAVVVLAVPAALVGPGWLVPRAIVPAERTLKLTPFAMRLVPAVAGSLTVPAMYFLARQMLPRGASLVAALFTACSAFMLFYSRDCKMYADAWLLVALHVGCLLWWLRTGSSTAFLCWVAAGCGMVGLNGNTMAVPAVDVVLLLTQRRLRWPTGVLFVVGLAVVFAGPAGYYGKFNTGAERIEDEGWAASGLGWNEWYNGSRDGPEHVAYTATAYLGGYEWPKTEFLPMVEPVLREVPQTISLELVGILAVAALPWPLVRAVVRPARQAARDRALPQPPWRTYLYLAAWVAVPTYGFYCHSLHEFWSPRAWVWELGDAVHPAVWAVLIGAGFVFASAAVFAPVLRGVFLRACLFAVATAAVFGLLLGVHAVARQASADAIFAGRPWHSVWIPRYLGYIWPAVGVGVAALLMRLPTRAVRMAAVAFFCAANLFVFGMRMRLQSEPPIDQLAADVWAAQGPAATVRTYDQITDGGIDVANTYLGVDSPKVTGGRYYLQMLSDRRPMSPDLFERSLSRRVPDPYVLREGYDAGMIKADLGRAPAAVVRVVIWSQLKRGETLRFDDLSTLPRGWRLAHEDVYPVRVSWFWQQLRTWVRREYGRPAVRSPHR